AYLSLPEGTASAVGLIAMMTDHYCVMEKLSNPYLHIKHGDGVSLSGSTVQLIIHAWFAKMEFVEYLDLVGLGHFPRLTRFEWGVIRSSLGKPRRFSERFLMEEREKLNQYRESVRADYAQLRAGIGIGSLPTDLAQPLSVGQRVIAVHPKTREIHDGSVLIVDRNRYRIQFDSPELGVEFVMDIDCMPLNPLENLPALLVRQHAAISEYVENYNEPKMNGQPKESKMEVEESMKFAQCENLENA
ncbi:Always early, putative isoform 3, partial [Corchorus capsularis]